MSAQILEYFVQVFVQVIIFVFKWGLWYQLQTLELRNKELKQSEEKVKSANSELCTKMREMIQELDQEKQEAAERLDTCGDFFLRET